MTDRLSYSPKELHEATGIPLDRIRRAIAAGEVEVRYPSPKRQVITRAAAEAWLASMPTERATA